MTTRAQALPVAGAAIAMMLLAIFLFATVDTAAKWVIGLGLPAVQVAFFRYTGHFVISLGLMTARRDWNRMRGGGRLGLVILRGLTLVCATVGNFIALSFLPLTITSAIMFSVPILICLLSERFLGEKVGIWRWSAILLGFAGVLIVVNPFGEAFHWAAPLCVLNALLMAIYSLMTRALSQTVTAASLQFYGGLTGTVALGSLAAAVWVTPPSGVALFCCAWVGFAGWFGHEMLTRAHQQAEANALAPYSYSLLLWMTAFDIALFGYLPTLSALIGIAIIVAAGLVIWYRGR